MPARINTPRTRQQRRRLAAADFFRRQQQKRIRDALQNIWTPAALFAAGQQGVWYEPRPEYLYQDSAGTTPVTGDGQPVGYMEDLSGNGNHATQDTASYKPLYRTDGVLHWLELDGLDDRLETPLILGPDRSVGATRVRRDSDGDGYVFGSTASPYSGQWLSSGNGSGQVIRLKGGSSTIF